MDRERWVYVFCYVLFTLHRDRDRDRERGPLGSIPIFPFPFPVPCSVNEPLEAINVNCCLCGIPEVGSRCVVPLRSYVLFKTVGIPNSKFSNGRNKTLNFTYIYLVNPAAKIYEKLRNLKSFLRWSRILENIKLNESKMSPRAHLHWALASTLRQCWDDASDILLIENNAVAPKWVATHSEVTPWFSTRTGSLASSQHAAQQA